MLRTHALLVLLGGRHLGCGARRRPSAREIKDLLVELQASRCEFERNGSWHTAAQARTHLLQKLNSIEKRTTLRSAEQFIELAASSSSASGRAYQVRCDGSVQPSAQWLGTQLQMIRAPRGAP